MLDRGEDPGALLGNRFGELHERRQSATTRPREPSVQEPFGGGCGKSVDLAELFFEQVGTVEPGVGLLDRRELGGLAVGEVVGSARGAVAAFRPLRFRGPPSEPVTWNST